MKNVSGINGLTVSCVNMERAVFYHGKKCARLSRTVATCEENTSYFGSATDSWEIYDTPLGLVERYYWCRGAALDRSGVEWRLIPFKEIADIQERFVKASAEMEAARVALEAVGGVKGGAE